jgi:hypothetical protein
MVGFLSNLYNFSFFTVKTHIKEGSLFNKAWTLGSDMSTPGSSCDSACPGSGGGCVRGPWPGRAEKGIMEKLQY